MKVAILVGFLVSVSVACEPVQSSKNLLTEKETLVVSFLILNHSKIISELNYGSGSCLSSLLSELGIENNHKNIHKMKNLVLTKKSTYDFAKAVVNEF